MNRLERTTLRRKFKCGFKRDHETHNLITRVWRALVCRVYDTLLVSLGPLQNRRVSCKNLDTFGGTLLKLSGNEGHHIEYSSLETSKNSCSKLHYQKVFNLIPFSYKIEAHTESVEGGHVRRWEYEQPSTQEIQYEKRIQFKSSWQ